MKTQAKKGAKTDTAKSPTQLRPQSVSQLAQLHKQFGNQAVQRLLQSKQIQAKLTIGAPNDIYEQEADRVADQVMRMPGTNTTARSITNPYAPLKIQRLHPGPGGESNRQQEHKGKDRGNGGEKLVQAKNVAGQTSQACDELENTINSFRGGGQALDQASRNFFEPRFGVDFSGVRVHTDSHAAESAHSVNAMAYTVGKDVVFNHGQYAPQKSEGKRLLAHELTHVVQQTGKTTPVLQRAWRLTAQSSPGTNCFAHATALPSTWQPPNPTRPYQEKAFLAAKMTSLGYTRASNGSFQRGKTKVMLIYDAGWPSKTASTATGAVVGGAAGAAVGAGIGTVVPVIGTAVGAIAGGIIGGIAGALTGNALVQPKAMIWKHAMVQKGSGSGKWESQNGIGGAIYDNIDTPISFVNRFYAPVRPGGSPGGVSLPATLLSQIKSWTNNIEYWVK